MFEDTRVIFDALEKSIQLKRADRDRIVLVLLAVDKEVAKRPCSDYAVLLYRAIQHKCSKEIMLAILAATKDSVQCNAFPILQEDVHAHASEESGYDHATPLLDVSLKPIERNFNHWSSTNETLVSATTKQKVKDILNSITKMNYKELSQQMCDISIPNYEVLSMIIRCIVEKAFNEPFFGNTSTYADLCLLLKKNINTDSFVHIIEERKKDCPVYYRWSNSMGTNDSEMFGPFRSEEECIDAAFIEDYKAPKPRQRGETELILVKSIIVEGTFLKIMQTQQSSEEAVPAPKLFAVFFPVEDARNFGQQLSEQFQSEKECREDSRRRNSVIRGLLNMCEEEFKKQDIYVDWKKERSEYETEKESMTEAKCKEMEEALEMKRIKIKKRRLGSIRFIGELIRKGLIKEKIMHECIQRLMRLERTLDGSLEQAKDDEMDEEDHEALCQLIYTIGEKIFHSSQRKLYFDRIEVFSNDKSVASQSRLLYKYFLRLNQPAGSKKATVWCSF